GQTITLTSGELVINKNVDIEGLGAANLTISGNDASRVFDITNAKAKVTIAGLTIAHGRAIHGAGIDNGAGKLTISGCIFTNNQVDGASNGDAAGGGIFNEAYASVTVSDSIFMGNEAHGGEVANGPGGYGIGGAIENQGVASFNHDTFVGNLAL